MAKSVKVDKFIENGKFCHDYIIINYIIFDRGEKIPCQNTANLSPRVTNVKMQKG